MNEHEYTFYGSTSRDMILTVIYSSKTVVIETLSVGLGDSLNFVLLLDGERVGALLGAVHDLIGQTLGAGLDVSESTVSGTLGDEGDGLIDSSQGRNVDGLSSNNTA